MAVRRSLRISFLCTASISQSQLGQAKAPEGERHWLEVRLRKPPPRQQGQRRQPSLSVKGSHCRQTPTLTCRKLQSPAWPKVHHAAAPPNLPSSLSRTGQPAALRLSGLLAGALKQVSAERGKARKLMMVVFSNL